MAKTQTLAPSTQAATAPAIPDNKTLWGFLKRFEPAPTHCNAAERPLPNDGFLLEAEVSETAAPDVLKLLQLSAVLSDRGRDRQRVEAVRVATAKDLYTREVRRYGEANTLRRAEEKKKYLAQIQRESVQIWDALSGHGIPLVLPAPDFSPRPQFEQEISLDEFARVVEPQIPGAVNFQGKSATAVRMTDAEFSAAIERADEALSNAQTALDEFTSAKPGRYFAVLFALLHQNLCNVNAAVRCDPAGRLTSDKNVVAFTAALHVNTAADWLQAEWFRPSADTPHLFAHPISPRLSLHPYPDQPIQIQR